MTTKDLEYYVVFVDKAGAGFETNDPNFESSTVGNILSNRTAGYRRNVVHERKSQWTQQTSLLSYFKKLSQWSQTSATTTLIGHQHRDKTFHQKKYRCVLSPFSRVRLFVTLWTVGHQTPLSMGFSRQEYWSGLPCPSSGDLPNSGIETESPVALLLQADSYCWATRELPKDSNND